MKREKCFSEFLSPTKTKYVYTLFVLIGHFQMIASQINQFNSEQVVRNDIEKYLVSRQTSISNGETLTCQYREKKLSPEHFSIWAAYGCYTFIRPDLIVNQIPVDGCAFNGEILPVLLVNVTNRCGHTFSIKDPTVQQAVLHSYSSENLYNRWLSCTQDAIDCCEIHLLGKSDIEQHCSPVWDAWTCFSEYTKAGEDKEMVCSKYAYSGTPPQCNHYSIKTCLDNATWVDITDYAPCDISPRIVTRTEWHIAMVSISIIVSFPALLILFVYKPLYTQKHYMIRNLIIALTWRNLLVLISKSTIIMDELTNDTTTTIMGNNGAGCRILTFLEKMAANLVFTCMLLEGIYLHQLLTNVFGTRRNAGVVKMLYYYIAGISISIITALVWSILMAVHYDINCWAVTDGNNLHWINDSPRLAMLLVNTILLVHIVVVMWKTFRSKSNEDSPGLRTARASLICLPLFGVPFLFIIFRPATESCGWEQFYYFVSYALEGLQCIFVVIFHCYLDREVQRLVKRSLKLLQETFNTDKNNKRASKYEDRRTTYSTYADSRPNIEPSPISPPVPANKENNLNFQNVSASAEIPEINHSNGYGNSRVVTSQISDVSLDPLYHNLPPLRKTETNTSNDYDNSSVVNGKISGVSLDPLYENLPPLNNKILTPKESVSNNPISALSFRGDSNSANNFFVNDEQENMFDYYYNDNKSTPTFDFVEPLTKNSSQLKQSNEIEDDVKLDPKIFFKNRAHGVQFVDDDSQY